MVLGAFFEDPLWIGVLERVEARRMTMCEITFGPEPEDYEVHGFLTKEYYDLRFNPVVTAAAKENHKNPKRVRRQAREELRESGLETKAQQTLKLQQEWIKTGRKVVSRENKEAEAIHQSGLKQ